MNQVDLLHYENISSLSEDFLRRRIGEIEKYILYLEESRQHVLPITRKTLEVNREILHIMSSQGSR